MDVLKQIVRRTQLPSALLYGQQLCRERKHGSAVALFAKFEHIIIGLQHHIIIVFKTDGALQPKEVLRVFAAFDRLEIALGLASQWRGGISMYGPFKRGLSQSIALRGIKGQSLIIVHRPCQRGVELKRALQIRRCLTVLF